LLKFIRKNLHRKLFQLICTALIGKRRSGGDCRRRNPRSESRRQDGAKLANHGSRFDNGSMQSTRIPAGMKVNFITAEESLINEKKSYRL
jgi:hypothetical protein